MSLPLASILSVPEQTAEVAHAAFPKGSRSLQMRDTLGTVYTHAAFADSVSPRWTTCRSPLALRLGDDHAMCREPHRPSSGGCGAGAH